MKLYKPFTNKKGDMPWWLITLIIGLFILIFILIMNSDTAKSIYSSLASIFKRW